MDKLDREALENEIRQKYPGITEKDITFVLGFYDMMQTKLAAYSTPGPEAKSGRKSKSGKKKKADRLVDSTKPGRTYVLYVSIVDCPVKVFRRIRVPSNLWLGNLARIIIEAVGWDGYHLWQFSKGGVNYTTRANIEESAAQGFDFVSEEVDDMTVTVADVLPQKGSTIDFEYDFGDSWMHKVRVSSVIDEPCHADEIAVMSGKGVCPPEDVGGVWGYARMLDILSGKIDDPEEKESYEAWLGLEKGEAFDTADFDVDYADADVWAVVEDILEGEV